MCLQFPCSVLPIRFTSNKRCSVLSIGLSVCLPLCLFALKSWCVPFCRQTQSALTVKRSLLLAFTLHKHNKAGRCAHADSHAGLLVRAPTALHRLRRSRVAPVCHATPRLHEGGRAAGQLTQANLLTGTCVNCRASSLTDGAIHRGGGKERKCNGAT